MTRKSQDRQSQPHGGEGLPYNPQDWNRRVAEARARRAATLRQGGPLRAKAVTPSQFLADAWEGDRKELAVVTGPISGPSTEPTEQRSTDPVPETGPDDAPARPFHWPGPVVTLLAGCLIGSSLTGLLLLGSGAERQPEAGAPNAGALLSAVPDALAAEPAEANAADTGPPSAITNVEEAVPDGTGPAPMVPAGNAAPETVAPEAQDPPEAPMRTARADGLLLGSGVRPPDPAARLAPAEGPMTESVPASDPLRQLEAPSMVNAPQVQFDALPAAPPAIERVVILAPNSVSAAGRNEAAALLREAGWPARDPGTSPFTIATTHVRYYHPGDREGAERLAALFSAEARDFTNYSPSPPSGRIELWLAGRSPTRGTYRQTPSLVRFLGRIAAALEGRG